VLALLQGFVEQPMPYYAQGVLKEVHEIVRGISSSLKTEYPIGEPWITPWLKLKWRVNHGQQYVSL